MHSNKLLRQARSIAGWFALGALYSVSFIQYPLYTENQNTKFLHAAAQRGIGDLGSDWMANTLDPLPFFTAIINLLYGIDAIWLTYLLFPALAALLLYALSGIADHLFGIKRHAATFWLFLALIVLEHRNIQLGFGTQYLIGHYFQPCVFGVFILLGIYRFLQAKRLQASFWLAFAAAIHPAYMPAALLLQGAFTLLSISEERAITRESWLPLLLFMLLSAPLLIRYRLLFTPTTPDMAAEALRLLSEQRIQVHTKVRAWLNYEDYIGMGLIALAMLKARKTPLFVIMLPLAALIAFSVTLLWFIEWPSLEVLTPWRTSVILLPLAWTILGGWLIGKLAPLLAQRKLAGLLLQSAGMLAIATTVALHLPKQVRTFEQGILRPANAVTRFARTHRDDDSDLWLIPNRETAFEPFRITSGRPAFINWKSHPYKDREILEWYGRNHEADRFYSQVSSKEGARQLRTLMDAYGIDHVVLPASADLSYYSWAHLDYRDEHYAVLCLKPHQKG